MQDIKFFDLINSTLRHHQVEITLPNSPLDGKVGKCGDIYSSHPFIIEVWVDGHRHLIDVSDLRLLE